MLTILVACQPGSEPVQEGGREVVAPAEVHVVATSDALARIADVQPTGDGRLWVLNSMEPFFIVVGNDGRVERTFGTRGGGPEEYGAPVRLALGPGGEVWVYDVVRNSLRRLSGDQPRDLPLPPDSLPPGRLVSFAHAGLRPGPLWIQADSSGFLLGRKRPTASPIGGLGIWRADIVKLRLEPDGAPLEPSIAVADLLGDPTELYPGATALLPYPIWTVCGDGTLGLYDPPANTLRRFGPGGREEDTLSLPPERHVPVTFDRVFRMMYRQLVEQTPQLPDSAQMRATLEEQFRRTASTFADEFPEYADLLCAEGGVFWLQLFDVASGRFGRGPEWLRLEGDGERRIVLFPNEFTVHRIHGDRAWGAMVDSLGVPAVAWVGVEGSM